MRDRKLDRFDACEIGRIKNMLTPRLGLDRLTEHRRKRVEHWIKRRDARQAERQAARFKTITQIGIDQRIKHQPRILSYFIERAQHMSLAAHHWPKMADGFDAVKLRQRGFGDILERFAGRVGQKMEMKSRHAARLWKSPWIALAESLGIEKRLDTTPAHQNRLHRFIHSYDAIAALCG